MFLLGFNTFFLGVEDGPVTRVLLSSLPLFGPAGPGTHAPQERAKEQREKEAKGDYSGDGGKQPPQEARLGCFAAASSPIHACLIQTLKETCAEHVFSACTDPSLGRSARLPDLPLFELSPDNGRLDEAAA